MAIQTHPPDKKTYGTSCASLPPKDPEADTGADPIAIGKSVPPNFIINSSFTGLGYTFSWLNGLRLGVLTVIVESKPVCLISILSS